MIIIDTFGKLHIEKGTQDRFVSSQMDIGTVLLLQ